MDLKQSICRTVLQQVRQELTTYFSVHCTNQSTDFAATL